MSSEGKEEEESASPAALDRVENGEEVVSEGKEEEEEVASPTAPGRVEHGANKASSTAAGYKQAKRYINIYLKEKEFDEFDNLTETDLEGDHLKNFIENIYLWLASTQFKTHQGLWMAQSGKEKLFSQMKQVWKYKCNNRPDVIGDNEYWKELEKSFKEDCKRHRIEDP
eukprot:scaffold15136_cov77-Cyclotella_meneghiniana.AAC.1